MKENLKVTRYQNGETIGTTIPANKDVSGKFQWPCDSIESNVAEYGRLYTWYAVADSRNICPKDWHVPSDEDWILLTEYLGGDSIAGGKMREEGTKHWLYPNTVSTNESGLTIIPTGLRQFNGRFDNTDGGSAQFWTSSEDTIHNCNGWERDFLLTGKNIYRSLLMKSYGLSVRCLKDN
jgi:uncharacterized protein (TIGR02145 family)